MNLILEYPDTATFVLAQSGDYAGKKTVDEQAEVPVIFVQATQFSHSSYQDAIDADAICWPDYTNSFIAANANRLEGMYVLMELYGGDPDKSWFKVENVVINRDHLLNNSIDNIECRLKKTTPIPGVS